MHVLCAYAAAIEAGPLPDAGLAVEFLQLGVGKTAASNTLTRRLAAAPPDLVVLFGIAGAYHDRGLAVGDLCLVTEDRLADEGVETDTGFLDLEQLDLGRVGPFAMSQNHTELVASRLGIAAAVSGATVSTCSGTGERAATLTARTGAATESMEGAAVALVCEQAGVPLVQLRCISNFTGDRANGEWDLVSSTARVQEAVRQLAENPGKITPSAEGSR